MHLCKTLLISGLILMISPVSAQDLDPRAYIRVPYNTRLAGVVYSYSFGGIVLEPTVPIEGIEAKVQTLAFSYLHSFRLFGLTSQAMVAVPYSFANIDGSVRGQPQTTSRSGLGDIRARFSILLAGAPAATLPEILKTPRKTIIGFSINLTAPTGEYYPDKLINISTHRFLVKPELAVSHPFGGQWMIDFYSGIWLFTANHSFYPGSSVLTQQPLGAFQAHLSYNINKLSWIAFDATYYVGGTSSVDDLYNDNRQSNVRLGITALIPVGKTNFIKLAASDGAIVRSGQDFTTLSIGWQTSWFGKTDKDSE